MKIIEINEKKFELLEDVRGAYEEDALKEKLTDYFDPYDYIVGDWSYGKLRLKGFNDKSNKNYNKINAFEGVKDYIQNYCAYGCKYFVIKRIDK